MKTVVSSKLARVAAVVVTFAVAVCSMAFAPAVVYAQGSGPENPPAVTPAVEGKEINPTRIFKRLQREVKLQGRNLEKAERAGDKLQKLVDTAKENGKDVASLEAALTAYDSALEEARGYNAQAEEALKTHAGFDAQGKVTDPAAALKTVEDAGKAMRDARQTLKEAGADLRDAARAWREANPRPEKTPAP